jgi:endonuclease I
VPVRPGDLTSFRFGKTHRSFDPIPQDATTAELHKLLADNWSRVADGDLIAKGEASFLKRLASHPAADDALRADIVARAEGIELSESARDAGVQDFFELLKPPKLADDGPGAGSNAGGMSLLDVRAGALPEDVPDARVPDLGPTQSELRGVSPDLDTTGLRQLFERRLPQLLDGPDGRPELVKSELSWVAKLARHPAATPALRREIEARLRDVPLHPDAEKAGARLLLAALGEGARPITEAVSGTRRGAQDEFVFGPPQYELGSIPGHYAATELRELFERQWPLIADGGELLSTELAWLHELVSRKGASSKLRKEVATRLSTLTLHDGVPTAAFDAFSQALQTGRAIARPPERPEPAPVRLPPLDLPDADPALPKIEAGRDAAQLGFLLDDALPRLAATGKDGIGAAGAAWLLELASQPNADARLRLKIAYRAQGRFDADASARGADTLLEALRKGGRLIETPNLAIEHVDRALGTIKDVLLGAAGPKGAVDPVSVAQAVTALSVVEAEAVSGFFQALVADRATDDVLTIDDVTAAWQQAADSVRRADANADGLSGGELLHVGALGGAAIDLARTLSRHAASGVVPTPDDRFAGLQNDTLKTALRDHAAVHLVMGYDRARQALFSDVDNEGGVVVDVYTQRTIQTTTIPSADGPGGVNTEHTRPRSRGVDHTAAESDLHHLFPTNAVANARRSSYPFGHVVDVLWCDGDARLGYDESGRMVFEPPDDHKGNVARALFYVSSTYDLPINDVEEGVLRRWNLEDPVDAREVRRNERIEHHQKNRNPFIDDPTLADRIDDF